MIFSLPLVLAASLSAGSATFDRTAVEGAASITLQHLKKTVVSRPPDSGRLAAAMTADPAAYVSRREAEEKCRALFRQTLADDYLRQAGEVLARLGLKQPPEPLAEQDAARAEQEHYAATFAQAREQACAAQAALLVSSTRPSVAEFEAMDADSLRREMTSRIAREQTTPVFEENLGYIAEKVVAPVIAAGEKERRRQTEYLMRTRSEAMAPDRLAADLAGRLVANVADRRAKEADPLQVWDVFPSVTNAALAAAVERRTLERMNVAISLYQPRLDAETLAREIAADRPRHVSRQASEQAFAARCQQETVEQAFAKLVEAAPEAERQALADYLRPRLRAESVVKAAESFWRRELRPKWNAARDELAQRETAQLWPQLEDGTWFPAAQLADETAARSDYEEAVRAWRMISELDALASPGGGVAVLEESAALADRDVAAAFARARNAIAAQKDIVEQCHQSVLEESRRRRDAFWNGRPDLGKIVELLETATAGLWRERQLQVLWPDGRMPRNATEQHAELFPSVKRHIELVARAILAELAESPEKSESRSEDEQPPETPPPEPPEELELIAISVRRLGGEVEIQLKSGNRTLDERKVPADLTGFENAMREVAGRLAREALGL